MTVFGDMPLGAAMSAPLRYATPHGGVRRTGVVKSLPVGEFGIDKMEGWEHQHGGRGIVEVSV